MSEREREYKTFDIPQFNFKGIKRIEIPKFDKDFSAENNFGIDIIKKYLPSIMKEYSDNAKKIDFLYNFFLGDQDIRAKTRRYDIDKYNNNKITENHAKRQVDFKVGFLTGEQRDYTHKSDSDSDDLTFLNRYLTDVNFYPKDKQLKTWIYATGIGVSKTTPRTDIIKENGEYLTSETGFDIEYESPFNYSVLDPRTNFVVYSSNSDKTPLFCVSIIDIDISTKDDVSPVIGKNLHIETRYICIDVESDSKYISFTYPTYLQGDSEKVVYTVKSAHYLPLIEYSTNEDRLGLIELNRDLFNTINTFRSAIADMTVDSANAILVFKNVDIDSEQVQAMKEAGAIIISDSNEAKQGSQADLKTITMEIPFDGLNTYIDQLLQQCYDIAGVPLASGQVTSGGDTGQARLLGGGWNNAYIIINNDITTLKGYDYEELKLMLFLCKQVPNCPVDKLFASQIDINYRVNQNDNFLVKTQGMKYLYEMNMPLEFILKFARASNDVKTDSKNWQENIDRLREQEIQDSNSSQE